MTLNMCEMWFNRIKIAFFPKNYKKSPNSWGLRPQTAKASGRWGPAPDPRLWYVWVTLAFSKRLQSYVLALFNYISLSPLFFAKSWLSANRQIFDDVIACDLWFRPPQSKILATPTNWKLPEKLFWRPFFFWRTLAAVSLVLGLGLEHSCPWPREGLSSERLSLALASDFFLCPWPWPRALCPRLHLWLLWHWLENI